MVDAISGSRLAKMALGGRLMASARRTVFNYASCTGDPTKSLLHIPSVARLIGFEWLKIAGSLLSATADANSGAGSVGLYTHFLLLLMLASARFSILATAFA
jgi:hypothetical protein